MAARGARGNGLSDREVKDVSFETFVSDPDVAPTFSLHANQSETALSSSVSDRLG
jgi:hypothetical protein